MCGLSSTQTCSHAERAPETPRCTTQEAYRDDRYTTQAVGTETLTHNTRTAHDHESALPCSSGEPTGTRSTHHYSVSPCEAADALASERAAQNPSRAPLPPRKRQRSVEKRTPRALRSAGGLGESPRVPPVAPSECARLCLLRGGGSSPRAPLNATRPSASEAATYRPEAARCLDEGSRSRRRGQSRSAGGSPRC